MSVSITTEQRKSLLSKALQARESSYCPYSKFRVGACLLTQDGQFITGCNIENASYGAGICAERTAMTKAVSEGQTKFLAVAVSSDLDEPCSPCGICRQFIREFCALEVGPDAEAPFSLAEATSSAPQTPVLMVHSTWTAAEDQPEKVLEVSLGGLLPHSFGPDHLNR